MASHAGLIYILKTKKGYVDKLGNYTYDSKEALRINFMRFGYGPSAYQVFQRLGFHDDELKKEDIGFVTVVPSYEGRLGYIESYYEEMGYDLQSSMKQAELDFYFYHLQNDHEYFKYLEVMKAKSCEYWHTRVEPEQVTLNNQVINLYHVKNFEHSSEDYTEKFYSDKDVVYRYHFRLKNPHLEKYYNDANEIIDELNNWQNEGIIEAVKQTIMESRFEANIGDNFKLLDISIQNGELVIYANDMNLALRDVIGKSIRNHYSEREMHVTRMFGSYILLRRENGKLKAIKATTIPIKYCPLMIKLLKEVGGNVAEILIETLKTNDIDLQKRIMCELINNVVIKGGYFATDRPLNSCEMNVLFGASETIASAFDSNMVDASVIVSNNLGTIITTNSSNTQGAVKRMTGLFFTSPSEEIINTAHQSGIIPVFPYTSTIDQLEGVKLAIKKGYKKIAVSVAAMENYLLEELSKLETNGVKIYKFGLCSTGIDEHTAEIMKNNADVVWSCASKYVKEVIEPNAIAQVGIKIPVHIMTKQGWDIVKNHLIHMSTTFDGENINLTSGENKPVILNNDAKIKVLCKKDLHVCADCPQPCI